MKQSLNRRHHLDVLCCFVSSSFEILFFGYKLRIASRKRKGEIEKEKQKQKQKQKQKKKKKQKQKQKKKSENSHFKYLGGTFFNSQRTIILLWSSQASKQSQPTDNKLSAFGFTTLDT